MVMVVAGFTSAQAAVNFSGTWVLDIGKSNLGMNNPAAKARMNKVTLVIKQTATQLTLNVQQATQLPIILMAAKVSTTCPTAFSQKLP
jgi:capsule polysaccharide export protein KpsC/LpsZ